MRPAVVAAAADAVPPVALAAASAHLGEFLLAISGFWTT